jgi:hypothetical protein
MSLYYLPYQGDIVTAKNKYTAAARIAQNGIDAPLRVTFSKIAGPTEENAYWNAFVRHAALRDQAITAEREGKPHDPALAKKQAEALIRREEIVVRTLLATRTMTRSNLASHFNPLLGKAHDHRAYARVYEEAGAPTLASLARMRI